MATPVIMPRQGQSVESCIFNEWYFDIGEKVNKGDLLFSYETDKAAFEGEATENGTLLAIFAESGDEVPVLQNIAVIGSEGEDIEAFRPGDIEKKYEIDEKKEINLADKGVEKKHEIKTDQTTESGNVKISPRAKKAAGKHQVSYKGIPGSGPSGRIIEKDIFNKRKEAPMATPLARSISYRDHLDMPSRGSGAGGKITAADLRKIPEIVGRDDFEEIKVSNIRKIIAENMHASLQNTAQLTLHTSADARQIKLARNKIKDLMENNDGPNITLNDIVSYATVQTLLNHTNINAHFLGDNIRYYNNVHLGFAVDTTRGLMVPTVIYANQLTLESLSGKMKELALKAQEGNIDPELLKGATFTVTNLGAFDIEMFTPVLNPPQVGILGINTITLQPSELAADSFGFIPKIGLSLTFDHRAIDGAPAAAFLKEVKKQIEGFELVLKI